jgi:hypothetical protein
METSYRNVRKTNWDNFQTFLHNNLQTIDGSDPSNIEEIELLSNSLGNAIINSYENSCKLVKKRSGKTPPWWHDG